MDTEYFLKEAVRSIPDFPNPGVMFRDITTLLKDPAALRLGVDAMAKTLDGFDFDLILGPESRGFIFGMPVAYNLNKGFVPVRKAGKLPAEVARKAYALEYGESVIEMHRDAISPGTSVVIVDDLLATGGTAKAIADLVTELGGRVVAMTFLIELEALKGRSFMPSDIPIKSVLVY